jgi:hypothetical protein
MTIYYAYDTTLQSATKITCVFKITHVRSHCHDHDDSSFCDYYSVFVEETICNLPQKVQTEFPTFHWRNIWQIIKGILFLFSSLLCLLAGPQCECVYCVFTVHILVVVVAPLE